jgi:hypothetical protein
MDPCHTSGEETLYVFTEMEGCHIYVPPIHGIPARHCIVALTHFVGEGKTVKSLPVQSKEPLPYSRWLNVYLFCGRLKTAISLLLQSKESLPYSSWINLLILS